MATTKKTSAKSSSSKKTSAKSTSTRKSSSTKASSNGHANGKEELMELFEHGLKDMYWVEKALTKAIPKMIKKARGEDLINALEDHLDVTEGQVEKLERIFSALDKAPRAKKCV